MDSGEEASMEEELSSVDDALVLVLGAGAAVEEDVAPG